MKKEKLIHLINGLDKNKIITINDENKNLIKIKIKIDNSISEETSINVYKDELNAVNLLTLWGQVATKIIGIKEKKVINTVIDSIKEKNKINVFNTNNLISFMGTNIKSLYKDIEKDISIRIYERLFVELIKEDLSINEYENKIDLLDFVLNSGSKVHRGLVLYCMDERSRKTHSYLNDYVKALCFSLNLVNIVNTYKNEVGTLNFAYGEAVINHPMLNAFHNVLVKNEEYINKKLLSRVYLESVFRLIENKKIDMRNEDMEFVILSHMKNSVFIYDIENNQNISYYSKNFNGHFLGDRKINVEKINDFLGSDTFVKLTNIEDILDIDIEKRSIDINYGIIRYTDVDNYKLDKYIKSTLSKLLNVSKIHYSDENENGIVSKISISYQDNIKTKIGENALKDLLELIKFQIKDIVFNEKNPNKKRKDLINSIRKIEISNKLLDREYEPIKKNKI